MNEHILRDTNGMMKGILHVDTSKQMDIDVWGVVDEVVRDYVSIHRNEVAMQIAQNDLTKRQNINRTGGNKTKTVRHALSIPIGLSIVLSRVMPDLFTNRRKLHHFMRTYKGFTTCDTI